MATQRLQIYRCKVCGNMVDVVHAAGGTLVCCGQNMWLLKEGETDAATEKHVPKVTKIDGGFRVAVGEITHPMEEKHYIEWIELVADGKAYREFLKAGQPPEATFHVAADNVSAREFCNLHGLWKG
ncbi:MAG: desulfoferrodoxin [Candidatus Zixiibacteriota bacterium]